MKTFKLSNYLYNKLIVLTFMLIISSTLYSADDYAKVDQRVQEAIKVSTSWQGPTFGNPMAPDKYIVFVASDLRNDGVNSVVKGMTKSIEGLKWNLHLLDGKGSKVRQSAALNRAIMLKPDGIVLGGIDAKYHENTLKAAQAFGIKIIGWHAANEAGPHPNLGLFTNITTDAEQVGDIAASLAIVDSKEKAQVVIFTDSNYSIATLKANSMASRIIACETCELLSVQDIPLDNIANEMPNAIARLLKQFPNQITHFLVINDLYIDFAIPSLKTSGLAPEDLPKSISAGDGSREAYLRIRSGKHQLATVPEPLFMQGWQITDEFNRAFHDAPDSGFLTPVHLIVRSNIQNIDLKIGVYDPDNQYRDAYRRIWK
ncbi:substrate-binding domain-containing protein [Marinomonas atlantica]|uniref:substrate-binding domain-containing protein n=1 Tax=Marinomonas atlantica TaxID=1806668 RepID=UPI000AB99FEA|nr:substrate-binding domain-containing protein [Marinomonas atlantica]